MYATNGVRNASVQGHQAPVEHDTVTLSRKLQRRIGLEVSSHEVATIDCASLEIFASGVRFDLALVGAYTAHVTNTGK
jgi:hypothetical protein